MVCSKIGWSSAGKVSMEGLCCILCVSSPLSARLWGCSVILSTLSWFSWTVCGRFGGRRDLTCVLKALFAVVELSMGARLRAGGTARHAASPILSVPLAGGGIEIHELLRRLGWFMMFGHFALVCRQLQRLRWRQMDLWIRRLSSLPATHAPRVFVFFSSYLVLIRGMIYRISEP